jgi:hypothetical protein
VILIGAAFMLLPRRSPTPADSPAAEAPAVAPATPSAAPAAPAPSAPAGDGRPRVSRPTAAAPVPAEAAPAGVEAVADAGTLRIDSDVPGAQVFIDRQFVGTTDRAT